MRQLIREQEGPHPAPPLVLPLLAEDQMQIRLWRMVLNQTAQLVQIEQEQVVRLHLLGRILKQVNVEGQLDEFQGTQIGGIITNGTRPFYK